MKSISAIICALVMFAGAAIAAEKNCCEKAKADGKDCEHKCCVKAKADGKVCETCNPKKKDDKK